MARKAVPKETYTRNARVVQVTDGDTVVLNVDLGLDLTYTMDCRLLGINAPEKNTKDGKASKAWMQDQLPVGAPVVVQTTQNKGNKEEKEKYGRYLATVYKPGNTTSLNEQIVKAGHALGWDGTGERPV